MVAGFAAQAIGPKIDPKDLSVMGFFLGSG